jgi:hypothetical protein
LPWLQAVLLHYSVGDVSLAYPTTEICAEIEGHFRKATAAEAIDLERLAVISWQSLCEAAESRYAALPLVLKALDLDCASLG